MSISAEQLGQRLREAREAGGLTQEDVGRHLEVARSAIAEIEAGRRSVSGLELDRLAHVFGRDVRDFLSPEPVGSPGDVLTALFRAQPSIVQSEALMDELRQSVRLGRELSNLEDRLDIQARAMTAAHYPLSPPRSRYEAVQQGEKTALEERRRLGLGDTPIDDLAELLEDEGVRTAWIELPDDVSGLSILDSSVGLFVVVNSSHHWYRRRFSYAHEYAHVLLDRDRLGSVSVVSERDDLREVRANAFAAAFLLPRGGVERFIENLGKGRPSRSRAQVFDESDVLRVEERSGPGTQVLQLYDVVQLAHHFDVSRMSVLYRLLNLSVVSRSDFERLKEQEEAGRGRQLYASLGLEEPPHQRARHEFRTRFLGLALEAYRREEITRGKLHELAALVKLEDEPLCSLLEEAGLLDEDGEEPQVPEGLG